MFPTSFTVLTIYQSRKFEYFVFGAENVLHCDWSSTWCYTMYMNNLDIRIFCVSMCFIHWLITVPLRKWTLYQEFRRKIGNLRTYQLTESSSDYIKFYIGHESWWNSIVKLSHTIKQDNKQLYNISFFVPWLVLWRN